MTSQLNYLIAQQRQAELVSRGEQARLAREARRAQPPSAPRRDASQAGGRSPSLAPGDAARVHARPAPPQAGPLAEAPGYAPLCAHGMNSLTDRGYDHALARLLCG